MTNEELLNVEDPLSLSSEDFNKWKNANKRIGEINKVTTTQLQNQLDYEEMKARLIKAKRDIKVNMLEIMKATIESENIYDKFISAENTAVARMQPSNIPTGEEFANSLLRGDE